MGLLRAGGKILAKDVRAELGSGETLTTLLIFSLAILVLFSFSFELTPREALRFLPGLFWLTVLFASVLGFSREMESEWRSGGFEGILLAPVPREAIFAGKLAGSCLFLLIVEIILLPLFFVFLGLSPSPSVLVLLLVPLVLVTAGLGALGTLLANICQVSRFGAILFSLGYFPLAVPLLVGGIGLSGGIIEGGQPGDGPWLSFLIAIDVIYLVAGGLLFEYLVEE